MYSLKSHVGCCHEKMPRHGGVFISSLSPVPSAVGLKFSASFVSSFLVQTPVGAGYMTLVVITNHLFPRRGKWGLNTGQM